MEKEENTKVKSTKIASNHKNLAIDLGASNIKIAGMVSSKIKLDKIKSLATTYGKDTKNTVILNGHKYHFGIGEPLIVRDKTKRKLIEESILLSYYKIYGKTKKQGQDVNIAIGVPINTYLSDNKLKTFNETLDELRNLTLDGIVNNENVTLKINDIKVYAEGYSAFSVIANDIDITNNNIIVDIGYKTTDVIALQIVNGEWEIISNFTISKAIWDIFMEVSKALFDIGIELSPEQIEQRLLNAPNLTLGDTKIDLNKMLLNGLPVVEYIYNQLDLQIPGLNTSNIYLIGGGSIFFNYILDNKYPNVILLDNENSLIYSNVIGFLQQMEDELE